MKTILHITPHFGGGVGSVLLNYLHEVRAHPSYRHRVLSLEYANDRAVLCSQRVGFFLKDRMSADHQGILSEIYRADIVLVHWWNHPLLYDFLIREPLPKSRVVIWSHISGLNPPFGFTIPLLDYPDYFVFTTPISFDAEVVRRFTASRKAKLRMIWSTGGVESLLAVKPKAHKNFKIGYIGTVDYCKMHPDFIQMSALVNIPKAEFVVCGGPSEKSISREAKDVAPATRFKFTGMIKDLRTYLREFDVFGYPLAPYHYGTCEQALCESMAAGVAPVVMGNPTEAHMIKDGDTGLIAKTPQEYAAAIRKLWRNPALRMEIAHNARQDAIKRFSMLHMIFSWEELFEQMLLLPKTKKVWRGGILGQKVFPVQIFLEAIGESGHYFKNSFEAFYSKDLAAAKKLAVQGFSQSRLWLSPTKGTPWHYSTFFPKDKCLSFWRDIAAEISNS